ncbi:MAG: flagellar hook-associated protein FlgK [Alphaproteobacteria bacterium]|nr:flagellar hook-associated protein FlgK [Alphaproteobacteria bacterium]
MSLTLALKTALSGLTAAQASLRVTSDNIANANTPGFTRKSVEFESRRILAQGAGVQTGEITRAVDEFVVGQIRDQISTVGDFTVRDQFLRQIQNLFGSPEDNRTLTNALNDLKNALETLALTPEFDANSVEVVNIARQLANMLNQTASTVQQLRADASGEIERLVNVVDANLKVIADLNSQIARAVTLNQTSSALEDERDRLIAAVSEHIDIRLVDNSDGTVTVFTGSGRLLVNGGTATDLSHTAAAQTSASVFYLDPSDPNYPGPITGIFVGGSTAPADDITSEIANGRLHALIDMRDNVLPNLQREMDYLAQSLMSEVNAVHNGGTAFPPPSSLTGSHAFAGADVFSANGTVRIAIINQTDGTVVETLDLALGGLTTVNAVAAAISGMTNATASLNANGQLVVAAANAGQGIAINELDSAVTTVGAETRGFSHFFGLNDLFQANVNGSTYSAFSTSRLNDSTTPLGLAGTLTFDANGLSTGVAYAVGDSIDDIAAAINGNGTLSGANITASVVDEGSGRRLIVQDSDGDNFVLTDSGTLLASTNMDNAPTSVSTVLSVSSTILASPSLVARGTLSNAGGLAPGDVGVSVGDGSAANALAGLLDSDIAFAATGGLSATTTTLARYAASALAVQSTLAASAQDELNFNTTFLATLETRNSAISGVNIDEELANLVILEQAFNASARVITVTSQMLDELINTVR